MNHYPILLQVDEDDAGVPRIHEQPLPAGFAHVAGRFVPVAGLSDRAVLVEEPRAKSEEPRGESREPTAAVAVVGGELVLARVVMGLGAHGGRVEAALVELLEAVSR